MSGWTLHWSAATPSTNMLALEGARKGAATGSVWITDHQTAGRGRLVGSERRAWIERPGCSILMSALLRPQVPMTVVSSLTLAAAVAFGEALRDLTDVPVEVKWPNDLLVAGRKLGGILTEATTDDRGRLAVVVGVGINVNGPREALPPEIAAAATSLEAESGRRQDRLELIVAMLGGLEEAAALFDLHQGLGPLADRWRALAAMQGRRVKLAQEDREGVPVDLSPDGGLVVDWDDQTRTTVRAGEVFFLPPAQSAQPSSSSSGQGSQESPTPSPSSST
jgi:BirA family biotin operon repressor/biotin-[acetyl-CoA-carboxylase] ligase